MKKNNFECPEYQGAIAFLYLCCAVFWVGFLFAMVISECQDCIQGIW